MILFQESLLTRWCMRSMTMSALSKMHSFQQSASNARAPDCVRMLPLRQAFASARGWTPRADAAEVGKKLAVLATAPNCVYLKPERGLISLSSMPNLHGAIVKHFCQSPAELEKQSADSDGHLLLWSEAKFRPVNKILLRSASSTDVVAYHIPAAASLEIQFTTRMAVSYVTKALSSRPLKLPCIVTEDDSSRERAQDVSTSGHILHRNWKISNENVFATAAVARASAMFLSEHVKQRMQQRGICASDIADAVSKGRIFRSSKQNLFFQTKAGLRVITDSQCKVAVTAFQAQAFAKRELEDKGADESDCSIFSQRKRGWSMRRKSSES